MTKDKLIASILDDSKIHHNITTIGMKLPDAPEGAPYDIFNEACSTLVDMFIEDWMNEPMNDCGNRNLCPCEHKMSNGACNKHDLWHVYTYGRSGATLYWDKYWKGENSGFYFKYDEDELKEMPMSELLDISKEIAHFNQAVAVLMKSLPDELTYRYEQWEADDKEEKRREAMGYNRSLGNLLEDKNPQIVRLAKGIKSELNK